MPASQSVEPRPTMILNEDETRASTSLVCSVCTSLFAPFHGNCFTDGETTCERLPRSRRAGTRNSLQSESRSLQRLVFPFPHPPLLRLPTQRCLCGPLALRAGARGTPCPNPTHTVHTSICSWSTLRQNAIRMNATRGHTSRLEKQQHENGRYFTHAAASYNVQARLTLPE